MSEFIVRGGLGNQLFIILEAYRILLSTGQPVQLNLTEYAIGTRSDRQFVAGMFLPQVLTDFQISKGIYAYIKYIHAKLSARFTNRTVSNFRLPGDATCSFLAHTGHRVHIGYFQHVGSTPIEVSALARMKALFMQTISNNCTNR